MRIEEKIRNELSYDPHTGIVSWKVGGGRRRVGMEAGWNIHEGYRALEIGGKSFKTHRVAWLLSFSEWPKNEVDHVNGNKSDNRLANLRDSTREGNCQNARIRKNNRSGVKGVSWHEKLQAWRAQIKAGKRCYSLGVYADISEAAEVVQLAREMLHGNFANHGYSRTA